jgi:ABC-type polysaccharide/polyol phosphate export permease
VRFPRQLVAFSVVGTQLVSFGVMLVILAVLNAVVIPDTRDTIWLALPLGALIVAFVAGLSLFVACANVFFRDVEHLLTAVLLPWFFLTPILYAIDKLPGNVDPDDRLVQVLRWANPITPPIEALHDVMWAGTLPAVSDVAYLVVAAIAALALGAFVFTRVDDRIALEL